MMEPSMRPGVGRGRGILRRDHFDKAEDTRAPLSESLDKAELELHCRDLLGTSEPEASSSGHSQSEISGKSESDESEERAASTSSMPQIPLPRRWDLNGAGSVESGGKTLSSSSVSSPDPSESSTTLSNQEERTLDAPLPIACFFPTYFNPPGPSQRVRRMKRCPVKIVNVFDKSGKVDVVFEDIKSKTLFTHLLHQMSRFYSTAEGFALQKPVEYLRTGEVVATSVSICRKRFRRVKITADGAVDIDDLRPCFPITFFTLIEEFYRHPTQACTLKVLNFHDLYPKDMFEIFFNQHRQDFDAVMLELSVKVLQSLGRQKVMISNLEIIDKEGHEGIGKLDLTCMSGFRSAFGEAFCDYFIPQIPESGESLIGHVTDIDTNGDISICTTSSLFQSIDHIINEADIAERFSKSKEYQEELLKKVENYHSSFLAFDNNDESRLYRIKILAFHHEKDKIKAFLMDKAKDVFMSFGNLVCSLRDNASFPDMLSLIPPQAIRYHLADVDFIAQPECANMLGKKVHFQVVHRSTLKCSLPAIEIEIIPDQPELP